MNARLWAGLAAASFAAACSTTDAKDRPTLTNDARGSAAAADAGHVMAHDGGAETTLDAGPPPMSALLGAAPRCTSGAMRDPNESEGPEMMPGHACIACHEENIAATGEDAPNFTFGGTAFPSGHEPDDCIGSGSEGAVITVTDAAGKVFTARANTSGNFFMEDAVAMFPLSAMIEWQGRRRAMKSPQTSGDCNSCHTQEGDNAAPGRITLP